MRREDIFSGDIVYWCRHNGNDDYSVRWGMVDEIFADVVIVDYLELKELRLVDGVPIEDFVSEERYRKLPKDWSYNTSLFKITLRDYEPPIDNYSPKNPYDIKKAYELGLLVKSKTIFHGTIEAEITKEGYRIRKTYPMWQHHIDYVSIIPYKLYSTYEEASKEVENNIAEFHRQANLSDYDWSVEKIDETLNGWQRYYDASDIERNKYKEWLLSRPRVEDIETRTCCGNIQWKYWKNKKWNNIEL